MAHTQEHAHPHPHAPVADPIASGEPLALYGLMERAVRELLVEKGVITPDELRRQIDVMDSRGPASGARIVARAWTDPAFKQRLLADAKAAATELGIDCSNMPAVVVLENTARRHHLVVCTLCSCYPKGILGVSPAWYKSDAYRARAVKDPRGVLAEFGTTLAADVEVRVADSTADMRYLVLPMRPGGTDGWSEERLAGIVTRDCMIGVTVPTV
jgi:nitrile hydratase alpha subunit